MAGPAEPPPDDLNDEGPPGGLADPRLDDALTDLLTPAFVAALRLLAQRAVEPDFPRVPEPLARFIRLRRISPVATRGIRSAFERHPEIREALGRELAESDVGRLRLLWFRRPPGWRAELAEALSETVAADDLEVARRRNEDLQSLLDEAQSDLEATTAELASSLRALAVSDASAAAMATRLDELTTQLAQAVEQADRAHAERTRAVRELKALEKRYADRVVAHKELLERVETAGPADDGGSGPTVGGPSLSDSERRAALDAIESASSALAGARDLLAWPLEPEAETSGAAAGSARPSRTVRRARGLSDDSAEGVGDLLGRPEVDVVIDGYNVTMRQWPNLQVAAQRDALERALALLVRGGTEERGRVRAQIMVVWDGDGAQAASHAGPEIAVRFTSVDVEADDVVIAEAARSVAAGRTSVAVSDDRRVRDGVEAVGGIPVAVASLTALFGL